MEDEATAAAEEVVGWRTKVGQAAPFVGVKEGEGVAAMAAKEGEEVVARSGEGNVGERKTGVEGLPAAS